jgi:hypothetical protein
MEGLNGGSSSEGEHQWRGRMEGAAVRASTNGWAEWREQLAAGTEAELWRPGLKQIICVPGG